jgi:hypothetical protein
MAQALGERNVCEKANGVRSAAWSRPERPVTDLVTA